MIFCSRPVPFEDFCTVMKYFCTTYEALYTTLRMTSQAAGLCGSWVIGFFLAPKYVPLQSKQLSAWMRKGYGNPGRISF